MSVGGNTYQDLLFFFFLFFFYGHIARPHDPHKMDIIQREEELLSLSTHIPHTITHICTHIHTYAHLTATHLLSHTHSQIPHPSRPTHTHPCLSSLLVFGCALMLRGMMRTSWTRAGEENLTMSTCSSPYREATTTHHTSTPLPTPLHPPPPPPSPCMYFWGRATEEFIQLDILLFICKLVQPSPWQHHTPVSSHSGITRQMHAE